MRAILFAVVTALAFLVAGMAVASAKGPSVFLTFGQCDQSWECGGDLRIVDTQTAAQKQALAACIAEHSGRAVKVGVGLPPADQIWLDITSNVEDGYTDARFNADERKWGWRYRRADRVLPAASSGFCETVSSSLKLVTAHIARKNPPDVFLAPGFGILDITPGDDVLKRCGPLLDHFEPLVSTGPDDLRLGMTVEEALRSGFLGTALKKEKDRGRSQDLVNKAQSGRLAKIAVTTNYLGYKSARVSSFFECGKLMSIDVALTPYVANDWSRLAKLIKSRYRGTVPASSEVADMKAGKRDCVATMSEDHSVNLIWRKAATWLRYGDPRLPEHAASGCAAQLGQRSMAD